MLIDKIVALLDNLSREEVDALPPARREKFALLCRHWHQLAERRQDQRPKTGILGKLKEGDRSQ